MHSSGARAHSIHIHVRATFLAWRCVYTYPTNCMHRSVQHRASTCSIYYMNTTIGIRAICDREAWYYNVNSKYHNNEIHTIVKGIIFATCVTLSLTCKRPPTPWVEDNLICSGMPGGTRRADDEINNLSALCRPVFTNKF